MKKEIFAIRENTNLKPKLIPFAIKSLEEQIKAYKNKK
tara:strand:- start:882 stop:995 length:114 start_codon:yes stop_codon:yes gene_type:complete